MLRQHTSMLNGIASGSKTSQKDKDSVLPFQIPLQSMESFKEAESLLQKSETRAIVVRKLSSFYL